MSILRKEAATLRATAERLEAAAADAPRSAEDLLKRFGPEVLQCDAIVELEILGRAEYDARRHIVNQLAQPLARHIAGKLQADFAGLRREPYPPLTPPGCERQARYVATVYAMSPAELKRLLGLAYRTGRESL